MIDRSRTGRVIMPAWQNRQPRVQPRKISTEKRSWTVSASGTSGLRGYGHESRSMSVCLCTRHGTPGRVGHDALDAAVGQVLDVVELRDVDAAGDREPVEQLVARRPAAAPGHPSAFHSRITSEIASTTSSPSPSTAASMKSAIGSGLNAEWPPASTIGSSIAAVGGVQRDAGEVERGQHVGVAELGGERDAEDVERPHRPVLVDGELRDAVVPHHLLHVRPHRVGALGEEPSRAR